MRTDLSRYGKRHRRPGVAACASTIGSHIDTYGRDPAPALEVQERKDMEEKEKEFIDYNQEETKKRQASDDE